MNDQPGFDALLDYLDCETASVSVGIALVKISGLRTSDVFRCADEAMYRGKNSGGDRMLVVDATLS